MRQSVTMRLDPGILSAARARAKATNRTLTNYVETLIMRDLAGHEENGKITIAAPEGTRGGSEASTPVGAAEISSDHSLAASTKKQGQPPKP
ncbi:hypothetical protein [Phreatobacter oligotrophus]|jgi:hypothetical protein|uniref:Uncharacterized protein n=1 Tax=Phreatobacter oligotrophus TaxID=1122261 RepID=A0A2T4YX41_9HYPH|nr:hypothetical protein [Phreatobacter oligotrophus]PTM49906.1 hypothetical protein C8P69_11620 [Phreatobacter oligotrophus]